MRLKLSLFVMIIITAIMIYQVIIRDHWSLKVSALFVIIYPVAVIVNITKIMIEESKQK
ncbi:hypothetical protein H9636_10960 [Ureibacillus sp. Re31]|uniref:Uncharacterized protein n=1 Tax=Ureibacillus galli TaxID=2762222 RepID=A0ABR8XD41_9BACL|nr:hypothetical protein [Ureibacillus galli]MBD8027174.1 hypothetical protein [Ureibacillus galli]